MKAIVVPPHFDPGPLPQTQTQPPTYRYTVVDPNGTAVFPPLYAQNTAGYISPPPPVYVPPVRNPILDYYALYSHQDLQTLNSVGSSWFSNTVMLAAYELVNKVWELRSVMEWINSACEDVVLVQRTSEGSTWMLVFISPNDRMSFLDWYGKQNVAKFTVSIANPERQQEYEEWVKTNIQGRIRSSTFLQDGRKSLTVSIEDRNEELLFKLRWVGVPEEEEDA